MPDERTPEHRTALLDFDDEFDPLAVDDLDIDQDEMEDDNPYDTIDYPTLRNMPEAMHREAVYTPERQGSVRAAVLELLDHNPARRPVLLAIIKMCGTQGMHAHEVTDAVNALQVDNRSVFEPMTLCRMLERAGALYLEMPETTETVKDIEEGVEYLRIAERVDPIWHATDESLSLAEELTSGAAFRDIVLSRDARYLVVYRAIMRALDEKPHSKADIEAIVDAFPIVQKPRRFGGHFIDMLERTDAIAWKNRQWTITDLGRSLLPAMDEAMLAQEQHAQESDSEEVRG